MHLPTAGRLEVRAIHNKYGVSEDEISVALQHAARVLNAGSSSGTTHTQKELRSAYSAIDSAERVDRKHTRLTTVEYAEGNSYSVSTEVDAEGMPLSLRFWRDSGEYVSQWSGLDEHGEEFSAPVSRGRINGNTYVEYSTSIGVLYRSFDILRDVLGLVPSCDDVDGVAMHRLPIGENERRILARFGYFYGLESIAANLDVRWAARKGRGGVTLLWHDPLGALLASQEFVFDGGVAFPQSYVASTYLPGRKQPIRVSRYLSTLSPSDLEWADLSWNPASTVAVRDLRFPHPLHYAMDAATRPIDGELEKTARVRAIAEVVSDVQARSAGTLASSGEQGERMSGDSGRLAVVPGASADGQSPPRSPLVVGGAEIGLVLEAIELPLLPVGSEQPFSLELYNAGTRPAIVSDISASCGSSAIDAIGTVVPPGEVVAISGVQQVTVRGMKVAAIRLTIREGDAEGIVSATLLVQGSPAIYAVERVLDVGIIPRGLRGEVTARLRHNGCVGSDSKLILADSELVPIGHVEFSSIECGAEECVAKLSLHVGPDAPLGGFVQVIDVEGSLCPGKTTPLVLIGTVSQTMEPGLESSEWPECFLLVWPEASTQMVRIPCSGSARFADGEQRMLWQGLELLLIEGEAGSVVLQATPLPGYRDWVGNDRLEQALVVIGDEEVAVMVVCAD